METEAAMSGREPGQGAAVQIAKSSVTSPVSMHNVRCAFCKEPSSERAVRQLPAGQHRGAGAAGLGLEAQQSAVSAFVASRALLGEQVEIEFGAVDNRPALVRALDTCRLTGATLLVALQRRGLPAQLAEGRCSDAVRG